MSKQKLKKMEILLIIAAGIVPVISAIYSLSLRSKKDIEMIEMQRNFESETYRLHENHSAEIKEKTDTITRLQNELKQKQDEQITNLKRLGTPISNVANVTFVTQINVPENEFLQFMEDIKNSNIHTGNLLPANIPSTTAIGQKTDQFKDILIKLTLSIKNRKGASISYMKSGVAQLMGLNEKNQNDTYILSYREDLKTIKLTAISKEMYINSPTHINLSMMDFENADIEFTIEFFLPIALKVGQQIQQQYRHEKDFLDLKIEQLRITFEGYRDVDITNIQKTKNSSFTGKYSW